MKEIICRTRNIVNFSTAYERLRSAGGFDPKIMVGYGAPGHGKTKASEWLYGQVRSNGLAIYLEVSTCWNTGSMIKEIGRALGIAPKRSTHDTLTAVIERLVQTTCPIFLDESDRLIGRGRETYNLCETLREIQDKSGAPLVLIGMDKFHIGIREIRQFDSRILDSVEFLPNSLEDFVLVAKTCCEVQVAPDLIAQLHQRTKGNLRRAQVGLRQVELLAQENGWTKISADQWGTRPFYFGDPGGES